MTNLQELATNNSPRSLHIDLHSYRKTTRPKDNTRNIARDTPPFAAVPLNVVGVVGWAGIENVTLLETVGEESNPPWDVVAALVPTTVRLPVVDSVAGWVGPTLAVERLPLVRLGAELSTGNTVEESRNVDP